MRVWRIPFSTNVERVALAAGHKRLDVEWVDVLPDDRTEVIAVSGQPLVPVLEANGDVVVDSTRILEELENRHPEPPLYPRDATRRGEAHLVIEWFDRVWKRAPNELEALVEEGREDDPRAALLADQLRSSRDVFETLLAEREFMFGDDFTAVDCSFFPFLKYGLLKDEADDELFHTILAKHLDLDGRYPRLEGWIRRVDVLPRA